MSSVRLDLLKIAVEAREADPWRAERGPVELGEGHQAAMRVPKGGSSCANCEYVDKEAHACANEHYQRWNNGSSALPPDLALDEICSDWYSPAKPLDEE